MDKETMPQTVQTSGGGDEGTWWLVGCRDGLALSNRAGPTGALCSERTTTLTDNAENADTADGADGEMAKEWVGPFASYAEARRAWSQRAWASVDDAAMRWSIVEGGTTVGPTSD
ncbi:MAG: DUF4170 domain-containing protein [Alphaproteobacteria bacterium]